MAQPGGTLIDPTPPHLPPSTAKRRRDDGDAEEAPETKRRAAGVDVDIVLRIVVPSRQIGKVIGKVGSRIQKIREDTKATIKIADAISRHEERVIIISSKGNNEPISDAENALRQIATLILKDDDDVSQDTQKVSTGHVAANTVRLLISGCQAGGLIGVSGQNIENLRISSGATITILAQNQLPLCASAYESDRVVQISGELPTVMKALEEIGSILRDNPPKQVIALSPTYKVGFSRPPVPNGCPTSADYVTVAVAVSEGMIGGLIGRSGSNISRIRNESGATIKVHGGKGEQKQRQIHIAGTSLQVALAKQRVDEYLYSQFIQQASPRSQLVDPATGMMTTVAPLHATTIPPTSDIPAYPGFPYYHAPPM